MPHHDDRYPRHDDRSGPPSDRERNADDGRPPRQFQDRDERRPGDGGGPYDRGPQGGHDGTGRGFGPGRRGAFRSGSGTDPGHRGSEPRDRWEDASDTSSGGSQGRAGYGAHEGDRDHRAYRGGGPSPARGPRDDDLDERSGREHRHPDYGSRTHDDREAQRSESWSARANPGRQAYADHGGRDYRHSDPEYHQWREEQIRSLDADYDAWRQDRYRRFSDEFGSWRSARQGQAQGSGPAPGQDAGGRSTGPGQSVSGSIAPEEPGAGARSGGAGTSAGGGSTVTGTGNGPAGSAEAGAGPGATAGTKSAG